MSLVYSGQLPRPGRGRPPGRDAPRDRHQSLRVLLAPRSGRGLPGARGGAGPLLRRARTACPRASTSSIARGSAEALTATRERPILVNNWEATYFDFDAEKILALADEAKALGIELCVLDDGWFGRRDDDRSSLGDWKVDEAQAPPRARGPRDAGRGEGPRIRPLVRARDGQPDSDLYAAHPDWCLHVPSRPRSEGRHQLVLDLGRPEVRRHIVDSVSAVLRLRADRLREVGHEPAHDRGGLRRTAPGAAEGDQPPLHPRALRGDGARSPAPSPKCSSRAARAGAAASIRASSPTCRRPGRATTPTRCRRLRIQYGTSLVYPPVAMGAHVSAAPNHQVGRSTPPRVPGRGGHVGQPRLRARPRRAGRRGKVRSGPAGGLLQERPGPRPVRGFLPDLEPLRGR